MPAGQLKWILVTIFGLLIVAGIIVSIIVAFRKKTFTVEPQPVEVRKSPKRYNHEQTEHRFGDVTRRLDGHDAELESLWKTMREEDADIREKNGERFEEIMRALGRIEGELKSK